MPGGFRIVNGANERDSRFAAKQSHDILIQPVLDFFQAAHPVFGLAGAGKLMVFALEQAHPSRHAVELQSGIHGNE